LVSSVVVIVQDYVFDEILKECVFSCYFFKGSFQYFYLFNAAVIFKGLLNVNLVSGVAKLVDDEFAAIVLKNRNNLNVIEQRINLKGFMRFLGSLSIYKVNKCLSMRLPNIPFELNILL
jgi:hypothetical protein